MIFRCGTAPMANRAISDLKAASQAWDAARKAERQAAAELREAIRQAREAGYSLAQIAAELGVTRQRVDQLSR